MNAPGGRPVVIITGAYGGLGSGLCAAFNEGDWQVVAGYRGTAPISRANEFPIALDVTSMSDITEAIEITINEFGRIDCLINNAGVTDDASILQMSDEQWQGVIDVNLKGAFRCMQAVSMQMIKQRRGHCINIGSFAARRGSAGQSNYVAAKAGLIALGESFAKELGSRNIRVNTVLPGILPTRMTEKLAPETLQDLVSENVLRRTNTIEEVASFIAFLAGTENISGQIFQLDSRISRWC